MRGIFGKFEIIIVGNNRKIDNELTGQIWDLNKQD